MTGEPGTGREVLARETHRLAGGAANQFIVVECSGREPGELDADILRLPAASGRTTMYLAHLAAMPLESQARLYRVVRESQTMAPGAEKLVRFSASLDVSIAAAVEEGHLLQELADLMLPVEVPALRQRKADVPLIADHLLVLAAERRGTPPRSFSRAASTLLSALPWPHNTPELSALVDLVASAVDRPVVELEDVLAHLRLATYTDRTATGLTLRKAREQFERECISAALIKHRGRMADAAQSLGIQRTNLYRKIRQLKVPRSGRPTAR
jgi:sigma-54-dependent transcriptional regulator